LSQTGHWSQLQPQGGADASNVFDTAAIQVEVAVTIIIAVSWLLLPGGRSHHCATSLPYSAIRLLLNLASTRRRGAAIIFLAFPTCLWYTYLN